LSWDFIDRLPLLPVPGAALRAVLGILSTRASACHSAMGRSACTSLSAVVLLLEILRNVMLHGSCVKARPRCARQQECYRGLTASEGKRACQAGLGAGGPQSRTSVCRRTGGAYACLTRCGRELADRVGTTCPHTPRGSLRSAVGQTVFYCRAVCRAGTGSGRVLPPLSARPDTGVNVAVDGPWQR
jgi:hypothetical protein